MTQLTFVAALDAYSGYGQHAIELVRGLEKRNISVAVRPIRSHDAFGAKVPSDIREKYVHCVQRAPVELLLHPPSFMPTPDKATVWLTTWESTRLPSRHVDALNRSKVVIVFNHWNASCFSASGVDAPIRVVPLGIDPAVFGHHPMPAMEPFVFGCGGRLMNGINRKGIAHIIRLFQAAFPETNVRLKIKCNPDCPIGTPPDTRVELLKAHLPTSELVNWYQSIHCYISFATGSWELMPHQAMAVGRPVLGLAFAGMAEFLGPDRSFIVPHTLVPASDAWTGLGAWAKANDSEIVNWLRYIATHPEEVSEKGWKSHRVAHALTWDNSIDRLMDVLGEFHLLAKPQSKPASTPKCFVQLGRFGDIINILPILREEHRRGNSPILVIGRYYSGLLDGVSYARPLIWDGEFSAVQAALDYARTIYPEAICTQTFGTDGYSFVRGESFNTDSWRLAGYRDHFDDLPLVFDKRNFERERELVRNFRFDKPTVALSLGGFSSPFPHGDALRSALAGCDVDLIDFSTIEGEKTYDLLGIIERADLLICSDSAPLHLAAATNTPVIAFITDQPTLWHGTTPRCRSLMKIRYNAVLDQMRPIVEAVAALTHTPRLLHVYQDFPGRGDTFRRNELARRTWQTVYATDRWAICSVTEPSLPRLFPDDRRSLPFIKDLIAQGVTRSVSDDEIIVLTNTDTCLSPVTSSAIRSALKSKDAAFCYRRDFVHLSAPLSTAQIETGKPYMGCDLFVFRVRWWKKHGHDMPDMILGGEGWDWCLRELIRSTGGGQLVDLIYHERHDTEWEIHRFNLACNKHNHALGKPLLEKLGVYAGEFDK